MLATASSSCETVQRAIAALQAHAEVTEHQQQQHRVDIQQNARIVDGGQPVQRVAGDQFAKVHHLALEATADDVGEIRLYRAAHRHQRAHRLDQFEKRRVIGRCADLRTRGQTIGDRLDLIEIRIAAALRAFEHLLRAAEDRIRERRRTVLTQPFDERATVGNQC